MERERWPCPAPGLCCCLMSTARDALVARRDHRLLHHVSATCENHILQCSQKGFQAFSKSENLGFGGFSSPSRPQEGLEKAPGSGPDRFAPIFSPVDQF